MNGPASVRRALVVMAKAPRPGHVKTRLARSLRHDAEVTLYRCLMEDTIALARATTGVSVRRGLPARRCAGAGCVARCRHRAAGRRGVGGGAHVGVPDPPGHRIRARDRVQQRQSAPARSGADEAFDQLGRAELVVGPTEDGGYYLVGATAAHPGLFDGQQIGTETALEALLGRARGLKLEVALTEPWYDIDDAADLVRLTAELRNAPPRAPRTAAWLAARPPFALR